ncbi:eukaryotic initiation factor 4a (nucleomorph) [Cryptomonas paramecium]|uniref:RNA helicase n=1 Tax=Cryptomonas paramaecium TaxID=2898 RepID=F2HHP3_9CRYP|nr:eukaryotic initiation factor 4a [Cryptomonas paramecium]AEA38839.1 eukaryotic initiation factor 4a [Cryptomonas paramecium]|mmetsp:Transcript_5580/g.17798  ORF Transcript_5580/g.17798 Transcript_5580/m.17798 type:complete len:391 (-) Transcript_5580:690-1862(-)
MNNITNHHKNLFAESIESFDEMGLNDKLVQGIYGYGYEKPSLIQQRGILPLLKKRDVIAQAQSGTGKTATFVIGTLQNINRTTHSICVLTITPTRELAFQIEQSFKEIGVHLKVKTQVCVGGTRLSRDIRYLLKYNPRIIIATPGRLFDILSLNTKILKKLQYVIIDEADEMFSKGFKFQIYRIFKFVPKLCTIGLFSATLPKEIIQIVETIMNEPVRIFVKKNELTLEGIKQFYIAVEEKWKLEAVCDIYRLMKITQSIVYVNSKKKAEWLAEKMSSNGFEVLCLHGSITQADRSAIMKNFRLGIRRVLITTDLLSRGIDVQQVCLVINYDLPTSKEIYIHRIGRSGRFGKKGIAVNLLVKNEVFVLREIESYYNTTIEEMPLDINEYL